MYFLDRFSNTSLTSFNLDTLNTGVDNYAMRFNLKVPNYAEASLTASITNIDETLDDTVSVSSLEDIGIANIFFGDAPAPSNWDVSDWLTQNEAEAPDIDNPFEAGNGNGTSVTAATGDMRIDGILEFEAWTDGTIFYSFPTSNAPYSYTTDLADLPANFTAITALQQAAAQFALNTSFGPTASQGFSVEGFTAQNVTQGATTSTTAEIRFGNSTGSSVTTARVADFPDGRITTQINDNGDVWFGANYNGGVNLSPQAGNYAWATMLHEIGHALGLKHGHSNYNFGALPGATDSMEYSVMTYRSYVGGPTSGYTNETWGYAQTYMMYDIAALQHIYGAGFTTNAGNTVYSWNPGSGDTLVNGNVGIDAGGNVIFATIWDGGGTDTYDLSAYSSNLSLDLRPGEHSVFDATQLASLGVGQVARGSIFNALQHQGNTASLIENAIGGSGNDTLRGNAANNTLTGGAGNDVLIGDLGADTLNGGDGDDTFNMNIGFDTTTVDTINGGAGVDTFDIDNFSSQYSVNLATGEWRRISDNLLLATMTNVENIIDGSNGNTLSGNSLDNFIDGKEGNDIITTGGGSDILNGGSGNDNIRANGGSSHVINGGTGNDDIGFASGSLTGNNSFDGGTGIDTFFFGNFSSSYTVDLTAGIFSGSVGNTLANFENIEAGSGSDTLIGTAGINVLNGNNGSDTIAGLAGADTMDGGAGVDTLDYSASGAGVTINLAANTASGGDAAGDIISNFENVIGSDSSDTLTGNAGNNVLDGGSGSDTLTGGDGNDTLIGGFFNDVVNGGAGDDVFIIADGDFLGSPTTHFNDTIDGGSGIDTLDFSGYSYTDHTVQINVDLLAGSYTSYGGTQTITGVENVTGSIEDDILTGDSQANILIGGGGNDIIDGGAGSDTTNAGDGDDLLIERDTTIDAHNGGAGTDTIDYDWGFWSSSVTFDLAAGHYTVGATIQDTFINFENLIFSGDADAIGSSADNMITGGAGVNTINGAGGNDTIEGRGGADMMDGGTGFNTLAYNSSDASVTVNLLLGTASGGHADGDIFMNFVNVIGSDFNDVLTGDAGSNVLLGQSGNDRFDGGDGDDTLFGDAGADTFLGGAGADAMDGGDGLDTVDYRAATSRVVLNLDTGGTLGDAAGDSYFSIERVYGSDFNDTITGTDANEFFFGEDGNDTINAGDGIDRVYGGNGNDIQRGDAGNDQLYGSAGSDQLNGGTGFDIANYRDAASAVSLNLGSGGTLGDAAGDTYFGIEAVYGSDFNDILAGNSSANELRGWDGDDILNGAGGSDRLFGGAGADALNGGTGVDIAVYTDAASGVTLNLATGGTVGDAAGDTFSSIEWVWGSDFNDIITGDAAGNRLEGRDGNDTLNGGDGNDRLIGGEGDDTINGGNGVDTIFGQNGNDNLIGAGGNDFFFGSAGGDTINGGLDFDTVSYLASTGGVDVNLLSGGTGGDAAGDSYSSVERVFGSQFVDTIIGDNGANTLLGNGGGDYLNGGLGNDSLFGGAGTDSYGYDTTNGDADVVNGFSTAGELIYILGGDTDFDTWAELQAVGTDAGANVIFNFGGGNTLTIVGQNLADLDAADFDFGGVPPAAEMLDDPDAYASEPLTFDEVMAIHQAFAADATEMQIDDALI